MVTRVAVKAIDDAWTSGSAKRQQALCPKRPLSLNTGQRFTGGGANGSVMESLASEATMGMHSLGLCRALYPFDFQAYPREVP